LNHIYFHLFVHGVYWLSGGPRKAKRGKRKREVIVQTSKILHSLITLISGSPYCGEEGTYRRARKEKISTKGGKKEKGVEFSDSYLSLRPRALFLFEGGVGGKNGGGREREGGEKIPVDPSFSFLSVVEGRGPGRGGKIFKRKKRRGGGGRPEAPRIWLSLRSPTRSTKSKDGGA